MSRLREAQRQSALLAALFGAEPSPDAVLAEQGERRRRGLAAYRANAATLAERALAASYPTLQHLVGAEDFAALARALWRQHPPRRGDLAQWGCELPEFIETERSLDPWPYLADCARLDAAVARCEAAADAALERDTLALLAEHAPERLRLVLLPCIQLLRSGWPIATLHAAHRTADDDDAIERARVALALRQGEAVLVARAGWRAEPCVLDDASWRWCAALAAGASLATALAAAGDGFDFQAWLLRALQQGWLLRAEPISDPHHDEERSHEHDLA
jgi:hypothetical protein